MVAHDVFENRLMPENHFVAAAKSEKENSQIILHLLLKKITFELQATHFRIPSALKGKGKRFNTTLNYE